MSVSNILGNALSGLSAAQGALRVISTNVANVNTPGYTRRIAEQVSVAVGDQPGGVALAPAQRAVDQYITKELRVRTADAQRYQTLQEFQDRVQTLLGRPQDSFSLSGRVGDMLGSLQSLSVNPESATDRADAVNKLQAFGDEVGREAQQVQALRADADQRVASTVQTINGFLASINDLNPQIAALKVKGADTTGLEEQRDQAVQKLSTLVDVQVLPQSDGTYFIATQSGTVLLDSALRQLNYTAQGTPMPGSSFAPISIDRIDPASGQAISTGTTLDSTLRGGQLKGLLDTRNVELPKLASELGELASSVVDQLNRVHNASSTVPAPQTLTGRNVGALGTDAQGFTGISTFAVTDANNNVVASTTVDFGALGGSLSNLLTTVNTALGGAGTLSLSNGALSFTAAAAGNGVVIAQDPATPSDRGGHGFSDFFGMNDLMTARVPAQYDTGLAGASAHGFASGTVGLRLVGPGGDVVGNVSLDLSTVGPSVNNLVSALNTSLSGFASFALDANGALTPTVNPNYPGYTLEVKSDTTDRGGSTGVPLSRFFGLGDAYRQNAAFDVKVRTDIAANPNLMALAQLSLGSTPALTPGDGRGALALAQIANQQVSFATAGDVPATSTTLSGYVGQVLSAAGNRAAQIDSLGKDTKATADAVQAQRDQFSAVNLDEELANMVQYQNAYNAAARLITTAQQLFDTLLATLPQ